jgi:hypothetical protein
VAPVCSTPPSPSPALPAGLGAAGVAGATAAAAGWSEPSEPVSHCHMAATSPRYSPVATAVAAAAPSSARS